MTPNLEQSRLRHGCIIMASGAGTRFGGNKLMAKLGEMPLIQHVIQATEGLFSRRVVVTRPTHVPNLCESLNVPVVLHDQPRRNDTVRLGMEAIEGCDTITFFQGDQPLISTSSIAALLQNAQDDPGSIWRASFEGAPGSPVLFPLWAFDELRNLPAGKGGGFIAKAHPHRVRTVEAFNAWELFDIDTAEDLQHAQGHLDANPQ